MTIVPDTNVLVAALVAKGLCTEVVLHAIRERRLVSSAGLMNELDAVLRRKFKITPAVKSFLELLRSEIPLVKPAPLPGRVCRDPDDDVVLATALAAEAAFIVTGDQDLLVLKSYQEVEIISPRQYLELHAE